MYYILFQILIQEHFVLSSITCVNSMEVSYIPIAKARGFTTHWINIYLSPVETAHPACTLCITLPSRASIFRTLTGFVPITALSQLLSAISQMLIIKLPTVTGSMKSLSAMTKRDSGSTNMAT